MGLFDHVRCDYPVPDARLQKATFQTKNLGCAMGYFTITIDGRLINEPTPWAKASPARGGEEWAFHGDIWIYGSVDDAGVEYVVRFTHGRVEWIRPAEEYEKDWPPRVSAMLKDPY